MNSETKSCPICLCEIIDKKYVELKPCKHVMCNKCFDENKTYSYKCPYDRLVVLSYDMFDKNDKFIKYVPFATKFEIKELSKLKHQSNKAITYILDYIKIILALSKLNSFDQSKASNHYYMLKYRKQLRVFYWYYDRYKNRMMQVKSIVRSMLTDCKSFQDDGLFVTIDAYRFVIFLRKISAISFLIHRFEFFLECEYSNIKRLKIQSLIYFKDIIVLLNAHYSKVVIECMQYTELYLSQASTNDKPLSKLKRKCMKILRNYDCNTKIDITKCSANSLQLTEFSDNHGMKFQELLVELLDITKHQIVEHIENFKVINNLENKKLLTEFYINFDYAKSTKSIIDEIQRFHHQIYAMFFEELHFYQFQNIENEFVNFDNWNFTQDNNYIRMVRGCFYIMDTILYLLEICENNRQLFDKYKIRKSIVDNLTLAGFLKAFNLLFRSFYRDNELFSEPKGDIIKLKIREIIDIIKY